MRSGLGLTIAVVLLAVRPAQGDQVTPPFGRVYFGEIAVGKDARAWGMGGAHIALGGNDPAAGAWNPAALALVTRPATTFTFLHENLRLEPQTRDVTGRDLADQPVTAGRITESSSGSTGVPFARLAFAYPIRIGKRVLVTGLSYERRVPFSLESSYAFTYRGLGTYAMSYDYRYEAAGSGGLDALSVSAATEVVRGWTLGVSVHRLIGAYSIPVRERYECRYEGTYSSWTEELRDDLRFEPTGTSVDVGTQVALRRWLFAGLVFKTGVNATLGYSNRSAFTNTDPRQEENRSGTLEGQGTLRLPWSMGLGFAVRPLETLTVAFDYLGTAWSRARLEHYARGIASGGNTLPGTYLYPTMKSPDVWAQRDTRRAHLGAEYVVRARSVALAVRMGTYWEDLLAFDASGEAQDARGLTAGLGVDVRSARVDVAWVRQKVYGNFVRDSVRTSLGYAF